MDTNLSWQSHITRSNSRINSALIQLARIKHLILRSDLRRAIQALALNHLHYCTLVWSTAGTSATTPILRSLRMAERLACSQFKGLGLLCREKIKVLRNRITQKRSLYNCLLLKSKGRAIKPLTRTKNVSGIAMFMGCAPVCDVWCSCVRDVYFEGLCRECFSLFKQANKLFFADQDIY